jgi:hypothetical protein
MEMETEPVTEPLLRLPDDLRDAFKTPLGAVYTDPERLLAAAGAPIVTVGDVVTYHLREAGRVPDVALVDGRTERQAVREEIASALAAADGRRETVANEPATLSRGLLTTLRDALATVTDTDPGTDGDGEPVTIEVDGEEDLATLPAILATPRGGSVVYGQPGEGMVLVAVTDDAVRTARDLLGRMDGDDDAALELLGVDDPGADERD